MSRLARRAVIATKGGGGGPTYAEFVTHITGLATSGEVLWGDFMDEGSWLATASSSPTGTLNGTSWGPAAAGGYAGAADNAASRAFQHALPSQAVFNDQIASARKLFAKVEFVAPSAKVAVARNGYTSLARSSVQGRIITQLLYWDGTQAQQMNPSTGTGPTPYTW